MDGCQRSGLWKLGPAQGQPRVGLWRVRGNKADQGVAIDALVGESLLMQVHRVNGDTRREPLPVEMLVPRHHRRITVADHLRWQETGRPPHADDDDLVDLLEELREVERNHRP